MLAVFLIAGNAVAGAKPKIAVIPTCEASSPYNLIEAAREVSGFLDVHVYAVGPGALPSVEGIELSAYDVVFIVGNSPEMIRIREAVDRARKKTKVIVVAPVVMEGNVDLSSHPRIELYWFNRCKENFKRLMVYMGVRFCGIAGDIEEPLVFPDAAMYHPDAPALFTEVDDYIDWYRANPRGRRYDTGALSIGLLFHKTDYTKKKLELIDTLIRRVEEKGCNVFTLYSSNSNSLVDAFTENNKPLVDAVISLKDQFDWTDHEKGIEAARRINVSFLYAPVHYRLTTKEWEDSPAGLGPEMASGLSYSEMSGMFEPIMIAGKRFDENGRDRKDPIDYQIDWRIERAISWARLHRMNNADKKIAVTYYSEGGGKGNVGADIDYYLDAQASLENILREMKVRGYDLGPTPSPDRNMLSHMMAEQGSNIGVWNKQEVEKRVRNGKVTLIPVEKYLSWFGELDAGKRGEVVRKWGPPPGKIMIHEDAGKKYIVIPGIEIGNVMLLPHPTWGILQDRKVLYSQEGVPPHHQYIAFWFWLNREFRANAVISIFTQMSLMPGKQCGLSRHDWGGLLLQNVPNIHPFPLQANSGLHNKRRAHALVIDYMPTIVPSGLYDDLRALKDKLSLYDGTVEQALKDTYARGIVEEVKRLKLDKELKVDAGKTDIGAIVPRLNAYLNEINREHMPYGPHTLSEPPRGEALTEMVSSMLGADFRRAVADAKGTEEDRKQLLRKVVSGGLGSREAQGDVLGRTDASVTAHLDLAVEYARRIEGCKNEVPRILDALEGKYILPGPMDDPIRNPDSLPTGRNPQGLDQRAFPTKEAWDIGKRLAGELLEQHLKEKGGYPRKVAFVLWSSETTKNHGVLEAQILYLLGVRPIWFNGRVKDVEIIDGVELGRPRVDVVITVSGLYRDHFQEKIRLLDRAVRLASAQKERNNPVRENSLSMEGELTKAGYGRDQARKVSTVRIFSEAIGAYSPNIQFAVPAGDTWKNDKEISDLYMGRMSHMYGEHLQGQEAKHVFRFNLRDVDAGVFSRSSNVYGILEHPMVAAYFGGLKMAVRNTTGKDIAMYITNLRDSKGARVETLDRFYTRELRSRYFNPKWIKEMMKHGYDGARYMDSFTENMHIWDVTSPEMVTEENWDEVNAVYIKDKHKLGLREYFDRSNPYALQSVVSTMIEAKERGHWHPSKEDLENLYRVYAGSVAKHGISGAYGSTSGKMHKAVSSALEGMRGRVPGLLKGYLSQVGRYGGEAGQPRQGGDRIAQSDPEQGAKRGEERVEGYEMQEMQDLSSPASLSPVPYALMAGVAVVVILLFWGFRRKR